MIMFLRSSKIPIHENNGLVMPVLFSSKQGMHAFIDVNR
jgi:hypothetical protein